MTDGKPIDPLRHRLWTSGGPFADLMRESADHIGRLEAEIERMRVWHLTYTHPHQVDRADEKLKASIAEAILAERERCAAVVENTYIGPRGPHETRARIAADIRKGIEP